MGHWLLPGVLLTPARKEAPAEREGNMTPAEITRLTIAALIVLALVKFGGMKIWHALVMAVIGFYLATSFVGPDIIRFLDSNLPTLFGSR